MLATLDGEPIEITDCISQPRTLFITIQDQAELLEAQRILTLADSRNLPARLLITLPPQNPIATAAIKRAANRFFTTEQNRNRVALLTPSEADSSPAKSFILDPSAARIWSSPALPTDADFDTPPFQITVN